LGKACYCGADDSWCNENCPTQEDPKTDGNCCTDADGDTYFAEGGECGEIDCDDTDPNTYPGADDSNCNGVDENCDGVADDSYSSTPTTCGVGACSAAGELICQDGNIDDTCAAGSPTDEKCDANLVDEDCDGTSNEECECYEGETQNCGSDVGECQHGIQTCDINGIWGTCAGEVLPSNETCDGLDNNCNGLTDEIFGDLGTSCTEGSGVCLAYGLRVCSSDGTGTICSAIPGEPTGTDDDCNGIDEDCSGIADNNYLPVSTNCGTGACASTGQLICANGATNDTCTAGLPGTEVCDSARVDENCNGTSNEGCACDEGETQSCGYNNIGECTLGTQTCSINGAWGSCIGAILLSDEICDGLDNDCNGNADETFTNKGDSCTVGLGVCENSGTYICKADGTNTECSVVPGAQTGLDDNCNGADENCNGVSDENYISTPTSCGADLCFNYGTLTCVSGETNDTCVPKPEVTVYQDADSDSYGNPFATLDVCTLPSGYVHDNTDCDDMEASVNPGAHDLCDAGNNVIPKDCNASNNDELNCGSFCGDTDADGFVPTEIHDNYNLIQIIVCFTKQPGDCDDNNAAIKPGAIEICDGVDNNCDGRIDEGCPAADKEDALALLASLSSSDSKSQKELATAIKELKESLGNMNAEGDKKIVWIDTTHISCRHGNKVFDHEKKAVHHLEKVTDASIKSSVNQAISIIVQADRNLALTAINEAPAGKEKTKAMEKFSKGEAETRNKQKIDEYKKAWKHLNSNKDCEKKGKVSCIDEITVLSPIGDLVTAVGDEVGSPDTVFTDVEDNQIAIKTDCNKCIKVGDVTKGWAITYILEDGTLALKCAKK
jgi:hypothetical protein